MKPKPAPKNEGKLSRAELAAATGKLKGWKVAKGKLHREYKFADFVHAFGFMATAALKIEAMGHHPEWFNVYNTVRVDLTTHDAGGISAKDVALAGILDTIAKKLG
jgi:4a-hydroxytetrahydrobiopterin dehydratase